MRSNISEHQFNINCYYACKMSCMNLRVTTEIKGEIKKYLRKNENERMTVQNLWGTEKAVLRGSIYSNMGLLIKQKRKFQINNLTLHLKEMKKEEQSLRLTERRK